MILVLMVNGTDIDMIMVMIVWNGGSSDTSTDGSNGTDIDNGTNIDMIMVMMVWNGSSSDTCTDDNNGTDIDNGTNI